MRPTTRLSDARLRIARAATRAIRRRIYASQSLVTRFMSVNGKLRKAWQQVKFLNDRIFDLKTRYDRACNGSNTKFSAALRLQMSGLKDVLNMYYEYANRKCDEMENIADKLRHLYNASYQPTS